MKTRRIERGEKVAPGLVLTRDLGSLKKGRVLSEADVRAIDAAVWKDLDVLELEPGDVHEDAAGRRLATALAGEGVGVGDVDGGSFPLVARRRGLVALDAARLTEINLVPDLAAYAHPQDYVALEGDVVGRAKVIPFVTREESVRRAEQLADGGIVRVRPFVPMRAALLVHEQIAEAALETARAVPGNPQALGQAIRDEQRAGARLLVLAGSRSMDPQDPVLQALELAGARMERHGVPAYPGTLLWVAYLGDVALLGAPSCGIFTRATSLDFVLPRLMAGDRMDAAAIAQLSSGGIVAPETSYRLAPYRKGVPRGQLE